jgi:hypothetical protein
MGAARLYPILDLPPSNRDEVLFTTVTTTKIISGQLQKIITNMSSIY